MKKHDEFRRAFLIGAAAGAAATTALAPDAIAQTHEHGVATTPADAAARILTRMTSCAISSVSTCGRTRNASP